MSLCDAAKTWLLAYMTALPKETLIIPATSIFNEGLKAGFSEQTLRRAYRSAGGQKPLKGSVSPFPWFWRRLSIGS